MFLFAIAVVLAGALNVDSFTIGQRLWKDDALRSAVVAQAGATVSAKQAECAKGATSPVDAAAKCVSEVKRLGLPIGWTEATSPKHGLQYPAKILGLLVTAFAVMLGAPFWFDFLGKASQLRSAGPKPKSTPGDSS